LAWVLTRARGLKHKSFLVLFFKQEHSSLLEAPLAQNQLVARPDAHLGSGHRLGSMSLEEDVARNRYRLAAHPDRVVVSSTQAMLLRLSEPAGGD
jgi:hypothetical protein